MAIINEKGEIIRGSGPQRQAQTGPQRPVPSNKSAKEESLPSGWAGAVIVLLLVIGVLQWLSSSPPVPERAVGEVFRDALKSGGKGPEMVVLPTGSSRMGDLSGDGDSDEGPIRTVNISKRIAMGRYEVTVDEFRRFVTASGYRTEAERNTGGSQGCRTLGSPTRNLWDWTPYRSWSNLVYKVEEDQPVVCVGRNDARRYIDWLNEDTGGGYRLPSESEWEYAARAGTRTRYSWGDEINCGQARYGRRSGGECSDSFDGTYSVGSFEPNAFGLFDMHGNVWEWVEDCWHDNYEDAPTDGRAWTSGCGSDVRAVVRGGSWYDIPWNLRSAYRYWIGPSDRGGNLGFRLVQDLNP